MNEMERLKAENAALRVERDALRDRRAELVEAAAGVVEVMRTGYHSISGDWFVSRKKMQKLAAALAMEAAHDQD